MPVISRFLNFYGKWMIKCKYLMDIIKAIMIILYIARPHVFRPSIYVL